MRAVRGHLPLAGDGPRWSCAICLRGMSFLLRPSRTRPAWLPMGGRPHQPWRKVAAPIEVPIWLSVFGPRGAALAGTVADGIVGPTHPTLPTAIIASGTVLDPQVSPQRGASAGLPHAAGLPGMAGSRRRMMQTEIATHSNLERLSITPLPCRAQAGALLCRSSGPLHTAGKLHS